MNIIPKTLRQLMNGHKKAEILNLYGRNVVRRLTVKGNDLEVDALVPEIYTFNLDQPIFYDPWEMDRGSLLLQCKQMPDGNAKLCTEADIIRYEDGTVRGILPHPEAPKASHMATITIHGNYPLLGLEPGSHLAVSDPNKGGALRLL